MRMFECLAVLSLASLLLSCAGDKGQTTGTRLDGRVTLEGYEGRHVYLESVSNDSSTAVDSALVEDGRFGFALEDSIPQVYELVLHTSDDDIFPIILPVVSEKGRVKASLGEYVLTTGTPLNDQLQDFLLAVSTLSDKQSTDMDMEAFKADFASLIEGHIRLNRDNALGQYLFGKYASKLSGEQRGRIESELKNIK